MLAFKKVSLRCMRLEVVGARENGRARRRHPSRAPVPSFAHFFQAPKKGVHEIIIIEQSWRGGGGAFKGHLGRVVLTRTSNPENV